MIRRLKPLVFVLCLAPLAWLAWRWSNNQLGFNRLETVARFTGDWTLRFLLASLAISPLRRLVPALNDLISYRRMLGLFAFAYGTLHFLHYLALDKLWEWNEIKTDFLLRRFFIAGLIAWALMIPLAATSFNRAIRWMGAKRWQLLHRLAYVAAIAGVVHFYWQGKSFVIDPVIYAIVLTALLGYRAFVWARKRVMRASAPRAS
ncbi:MAG: protein-methionine-sulfoxide reductase heme-binding subunit MsrQ [Bryobacteraceae bacterium]|nr:protein-methionine-sulfoxide reductase heme-binding subunit MsrQ [Bryobacteraceae bacterium]